MWAELGTSVESWTSTRGNFTYGGIIQKISFLFFSNSNNLHLMQYEIFCFLFCKFKNIVQQSIL